MKTLILYATKYGAAYEAAQRIAKHITGSVLHNLKQSGVTSLAGYDCVIIGSSVYVGSIRKEAKAFLSQNTNALKGKKVGLFLCGLQEAEEKAFFKNNFPDEILQTAKAVSFLGGIFDPAKSGILERFIMKAVAKQSGYIDTIDDGKIAQFSEELKK